jgi:hypothetical protein
LEDAELSKSEEIEAQAVDLWREYRFFLPGKVKKFLRDVAEFCQWEKLKKELER